MKIFLHIIVGFSLALAPLAGFGSLGDDELKISQAYGNPVAERQISPSLLERQYRFNDLAVTVTFLNGTSQREEFRRLDGAALSEEQIQALLGANANNLSWTSKASSAESGREWFIAGPKQTPAETSGGPAVFAVSGRTPPSQGGGKLIAVDMRKPDDGSATAPAAPPVLRKAVSKSVGTNNALAVFTAAYENVSKRELSQGSPRPDSAK